MTSSKLFVAAAALHNFLTDENDPLPDGWDTNESNYDASTDIDSDSDSLDDDGTVDEASNRGRRSEKTRQKLVEKIANNALIRRPR